MTADERLGTVAAAFAARTPPGALARAEGQATEIAAALLAGSRRARLGALLRAAANPRPGPARLGELVERERLAVRRLIAVHLTVSGAPRDVASDGAGSAPSPVRPGSAVLRRLLDEAVSGQG